MNNMKRIDRAVNLILEGADPEEQVDKLTEFSISGAAQRAAGVAGGALDWGAATGYKAIGLMAGALVITKTLRAIADWWGDRHSRIAMMNAGEIVLFELAKRGVIRDAESELAMEMIWPIMERIAKNRKVAERMRMIISDYTAAAGLDAAPSDADITGADNPIAVYSAHAKTATKKAQEVAIKEAAKFLAKETLQYILKIKGHFKKQVASSDAPSPNTVVQP